MGTLSWCRACERLTVLSRCPHCERRTVRCASPMEGEEDLRPTAQGSIGTSTPGSTRSSTTILTVADTETLANRHHRASAVDFAEKQLSEGKPVSVGIMQSVVQALMRENEELLANTELNRRQVLKSAMDVRDLHDSFKTIRQADVNRIHELERENAQMKAKLAEWGNSQPLRIALETRGDNVAAVAAPPPPRQDGITRGSAPIATHASKPDVGALQAEVEHLRRELQVKTHQLDKLWDRAERAEGYIGDLQRKLELVQDMTCEERSRSARLSRHLESVGRPPEDISAFTSMRE